MAFKSRLKNDMNKNNIILTLIDCACIKYACIIKPQLRQNTIQWNEKWIKLNKIYVTEIA